MRVCSGMMRRVGDGVRVWKRDGLAGQEYRYLCRIGCGGVPMRVYNRAMGGSSWVSVEDYLPAGNALGYNENWQYRHTGGELLLMGTTGEPSGYYPMDSNGLAVQNAPAQPCVCAVVAPAQTAACSPLGYGGCEGGQCDATPPNAPLPPNRDPIVSPSPTPPRNDPVITGVRLGPWNVIGCTPAQIAEIGKHLHDVCRFRVGGAPLYAVVYKICARVAIPFGAAQARSARGCVASLMFLGARSCCVLSLLPLNAVVWGRPSFTRWLTNVGLMSQVPGDVNGICIMRRALPRVPDKEVLQ
jgi:hypothetical protein